MTSEFKKTMKSNVYNVETLKNEIINNGLTIENLGVLNYDTNKILRDGFSRSSMSGEAFIAMAPAFDREVPHSDLTAKCFALYVGLDSLIELAAVQGPEGMD